MTDFGPCSCCPSLYVPQSLVMVNGALVCVVCDAALRFPALERENRALARIIEDMEAAGEL